MPPARSEPRPRRGTMMAATTHTTEPTPADAGGGPADWFASQIANLGAFAVDQVAGIGDVAIFSLKTLGWIFSRRQRRDVLLPNFYQIGVLSLPVVALTDRMTSPLVRFSDAILTVPEVDFGAFRSLSATIAMAIALAVAIGSARGG